jgi:hypothetical protein
MVMNTPKTYKLRPSGKADLPWELLDADNMQAPPLTSYVNLDDAMSALAFISKQGKVEYVSLVLTPALYFDMPTPPKARRRWFAFGR